MTTHVSDQWKASVVASVLVALTMACAGPEGPAGPAGTGTSSPALVTAYGTGPLVIDESVFGYAAIPGLSASVTVPSGSTESVLIETDGGVQLNSADPAASGFIDVAVFVDGAQVGAGRRVSVSNNGIVLYSVGSFGFSVQTSLSAGAHAITVMAKRFPVTLTDLYVSSAASGSGLPGNPRLQGILNVIAFP
jgi:hypothetical protein